MGTRGGIVRITGEGTFKGRYHHFDSYPDGLGVTLWQLYRERHGKNLDAMMKELIDDHPAGWSTINNCDWNLKPGYGGRDSVEEKRPQCYCHGDRSEEEQEVNQDNASGSGLEYVYAFGKEEGKDVMLILSSYVKGRKMVGWFGRGDPDAKWHIMAKIMLDDDTEPKWEKIGEQQEETD